MWRAIRDLGRGGGRTGGVNACSRMRVRVRFVGATVSTPRPGPKRLPKHNEHRDTREGLQLLSFLDKRPTAFVCEYRSFGPGVGRGGRWVFTGAEILRFRHRHRQL